MSDGTQIRTYERYPGWEHHHKMNSGLPTDLIYKDGVQVGGNWQGILPALRAIDRAEDPAFAEQYGVPAAAGLQELVPALEAADRADYTTVPAPAQSSRAIPAEEMRALTLLETSEQGMRLAIQILGTASDGPMDQAPAKIKRAITLLSHLAGGLHSSEIGDTRRQVLPEIDADVRRRLTELDTAVDKTLQAQNEYR